MGRGRGHSVGSMLKGSAWVSEKQNQGGDKVGLSVAIILAENFTLSAFALFVDHIRLAADEGDGSRQKDACWSVLSNGLGDTRSSCGVTVGSTDMFGDPTRYEYIVVVGGLLGTRNPIGAEAAEFIRRGAESGVTLVGLCTGTFILCRLGLMKGRRCCVSWYHHQDFVEEFPGHVAVADRLFVADGKRITCAGGAGTADLAAHLIESHLNRSAAQKATQVLMFDRARDGNENQPHPPILSDVAKGKVARALLIMEQNIMDPLPIQELSERLNMSKRQLERLCHDATGSTPSAIYRGIRLRYASWLLATTDRSITAIAQEAGFADSAHFSRTYKSHHGHPPTMKRKMGTGEASGHAAARRVYST